MGVRTIGVQYDRLGRFLFAALIVEEQGKRNGYSVLLDGGTVTERVKIADALVVAFRERTAAGPLGAGAVVRSRPAHMPWDHPIYVGRFMNRRQAMDALDMAHDLAEKNRRAGYAVERKERGGK